MILFDMFSKSVWCNKRFLTQMALVRSVRSMRKVMNFPRTGLFQGLFLTTDFTTIAHFENSPSILKMKLLVVLSLASKHAEKYFVKLNCFARKP